MRQLYQTKHFSLRRIPNSFGIDLEFIVLNSGDFDLVEEIGISILEKEFESIGYNVSDYIKSLESAKTEKDKDKVLYELYFIFNGIANSYC